MKPGDTDKPFTPPTAEQVTRHLDANPVRIKVSWSTWVPILILGVVCGLTFTVHTVLTMLLPWVMLGAVLVMISWRVNHMRNLERRVEKASELAMTRRHVESLRTAWRLLPDVSAWPAIHSRVTATIAHNLDQLQAFDAAMITYGRLIDQLPPDHPGAIETRIRQAITMLLTDRLLDADDALRRLRGMIAPFAGTPIAAAHRLASLLQQVRTNHFKDALEESADLVETLRPLGLEAGYGHAMMALCCYRLGADSGPDIAEQGAAWWARATLLIPPEALIARHAELKPLLETGWPVWSLDESGVLTR